MQEGTIPSIEEVLNAKKQRLFEEVKEQIGLGEHDVSDFQLAWLLENHAVAPANDKRKHAPPVYGKGHTDSVLDESDRFGQDDFIGNHAMVSWQSFAAASSGRHSRYHTGTLLARAFSVWWIPLAISLSQRIPEMQGTSVA